MSNKDEWDPIAKRKSSHMFGIYKEQDLNEKKKPLNKVKLVFIITTFAAASLVVCLGLLSVITNYGNSEASHFVSLEPHYEFSTQTSIKMEAPKINATNATLVNRELSKANKHSQDTSMESGEAQASVMYYDPVNGFRRRSRILSRQGHNPPRLVYRPVVYPPTAYYGLSPAQSAYYEQYAQLAASYNNPNRVKNIQDVMKYVKPQPAVKFTGVYVRAPMDEDGMEGEMSGLVPQATSVFSRPFLNGHGYVPDPFNKYKPSHPSEINYLAATDTDIDTAPRFSTRVVKPTHVGVATHTQAIFRPYDQPMEATTTKPEKKGKPLKIMLDLYPVQQAAPPVREQGKTQQAGATSVSYYHRYPSIQQQQMNNIFANNNPRPVYTRPTTPPPPPQGTPPKPEQERMIVHLNLYPKTVSKVKRRPENFGLIRGGRFQQRMYDSLPSPHEGEIVFMDDPLEAEPDSPFPDYSFEMEEVNETLTESGPVADVETDLAESPSEIYETKEWREPDVSSRRMRPPGIGFIDTLAPENEENEPNRGLEGEELDSVDNETPNTTVPFRDWETAIESYSQEETSPRGQLEADVEREVSFNKGRFPRVERNESLEDGEGGIIPESSLKPIGGQKGIKGISEDLTDAIIDLVGRSGTALPLEKKEKTSE